MLIIVGFCIRNAIRTAASKNAGVRFVGPIATEMGLFHGCLGRVYRCGSDDSFALLDGDELVRL